MFVLKVALKCDFEDKHFWSQNYNIISVLKVACPQSCLSSKSSVLKVACPQSRLSSKSRPQSRVLKVVSSTSHVLIVP